MPLQLGKALDGADILPQPFVELAAEQRRAPRRRYSSGASGAFSPGLTGATSAGAMTATPA